MNISLLLCLSVIAAKGVCNSLETKYYEIGDYRVFVATTPVYYVVSPDKCKELNGSVATRDGTSNSVLSLVAWLKLDPHVTKRSQYRFITKNFCQRDGVIINQNLIRMPDNRPCNFSKQYCFDNNEILIFWNIYSTYYPIVLFEGNLQVWHLNLETINQSFVIFTHETFNLTLISLNGFEGSLDFITTIEGVQVTKITTTTSRDYFNIESQKYFGNLVSREGTRNIGSILQEIFSSKSFTNIQLVASGYYQVLVPTQLVYLKLEPHQCRKYEGTVLSVQEYFSNGEDKFGKLLEGKNILRNDLTYVCRLRQDFLPSTDILKTPNGEPCKYGDGYCYLNNDSLAFWDSASLIYPRILYEGDLKIWKIENPTLSLKMTYAVDRNWYFRFYATDSTDGMFSCMDDNCEVYIQKVSVIGTERNVDINSFNNINDTYYNKKNYCNNSKFTNSTTNLKLNSPVYNFFSITVMVSILIYILINCIAFVSIVMHRNILFC